MNTDYKNIFNQSPCLTNDEMIDYISGKLSEDKIRKVELHIADCEMCSDELEGLSYLNDIKQLPIITSSLNNKIDDYFNKGKKIIPIHTEENKTTNKKFNLKRTFSIAASIALLITAGYFIYDIQNTSSNKLAEANIPAKDEYIKETPSNEIIKEEDVKEELTSNNKELNKPSENKKEKVNTVSDKKIKTETEKSKPTDVDEIIISEDVLAETDQDIELDKAEEIEEEDISVSDNNASNKVVFGTTRGAGINLKKKEKKDFKYLKDSGILSYSIKSYKDAITDFNKYLQNNPNDFEVVYKLGMSYYYTNNYDKAILKFNKIITARNIKYFEDAQWYKVNSLIKEGKKDDAIALLKNIINAKGKYLQQAQNKISELED